MEKTEKEISPATTQQITPEPPAEKSPVKTNQLKTFRSLIQAVKLCARLKASSDEYNRKKKAGAFQFPKGYDKVTYKKPQLYFNDVVEHPLVNVDLLDRFGSRVKSQSILRNHDVVALFFYSPRCELSNEVLPQLKNIHQKASMYKKRFEVVSIPCGCPSDEHNRWFRMNHGNWFGIDYNSDTRDLLRISYSIIAVPKIIVIDAKGNVITRSGVEELQTQGINVLVTWFGDTY